MVDINSFTNRDGPGTAITLNAERLDARIIEDDDMPVFPYDLIEAGEPMLLIQKGQLIQIQKKRDDGWMFGFVVWEPSELQESKNDDRPSRVHLKRKAQAIPASDLEAGDGERGLQLVDVEKSIDGNDEMKKEGNEFEFEFKGNNDDDEISENSGWFPSIFVRPPQMNELKEMQDAMGGQEKALDALAVPEYWSDEAKMGKLSTAKFVTIQKKSTEFTKIETDFLQTSEPNRKLKVQQIQRIENLSLWQTYAAKKCSFFMRASNEGIDPEKGSHQIPLCYEKLSMYHGTDADTSVKIAQTGFNRAFAGRNAVRCEFYFLQFHKLI